VARFVTIGYGDRAGYDRTDPSIRDAAHQHDERLLAEGALMGIAGQPVQVRSRDTPARDELQPYERRLATDLSRFSARARRRS
jgi:hypothetical protein